MNIHISIWRIIYIQVHLDRFGSFFHIYDIQGFNVQKKHYQVDIFKIEAVSLGKLEKCIVGYNGTESHQGWYLDKIIIRESEDFKKEYTFPCEK